MQGSFTGSNLLRNSYGFQTGETPLLRSGPGKGFPMPAGYGSHSGQEHIHSSIKQMENKIEGMETLIKKKYVEPNSPTLPAYSRPENGDPRARGQYLAPPVEEPLSQEMLRGSCQNILKKFDYSNLRNTTHFNPMNKVTTHNEMRRSPQ